MRLLRRVCIETDISLPGGFPGKVLVAETGDRCSVSGVAAIVSVWRNGHGREIRIIVAGAVHTLFSVATTDLEEVDHIVLREEFFITDHPACRYGGEHAPSFVRRKAGRSVAADIDS